MIYKLRHALAALFLAPFCIPAALGYILIWCFDVGPIPDFLSRLADKIGGEW